MAIEDKHHQTESDAASQATKKSKSSSKAPHQQVMVNKLWSLSCRAEKLVLEVEAVGAKCTMSELEAARGEKLKQNATLILELQVHLKTVIKSFDPTIAAEVASDMEKLLKDVQMMVKTAKRLVD